MDETSGIEPPIEITVSHVSVDQHRRLIRSFQITTLPVEQPELYRLVETIIALMESDAEDLGGLQRYQLTARCRGHEIGSTTVRYSLDPLSTGVDSEPPSERGLVAQAQRHAEAAVRMMVQGNGALLSSFQRRLADQDALIERMHARWIESMATKEEIIRERAELGLDAEERKTTREVQAAKELAAIDRNEKLLNEGISMLKLGVPMLYRYLSGDKGGGTVSPAEEAAYLATTTDEQIEVARQRLPPDVFDEYMEKVRRARDQGARQGKASPAPASATPVAPPPAPPPNVRPSLRRPVKPLEGDAKMGAVRLLAEELLPVITARHVAGEPLIDPGTDDLSLYLLLRRLAVSTTPTEWSVVLSSLPDDQRAATEALLALLKIVPRSEGDVP